jgi:hypothetical protein
MTCRNDKIIIHSQSTFLAQGYVTGYSHYGDMVGLVNCERGQGGAVKDKHGRQYKDGLPRKDKQSGQHKNLLTHKGQACLATQGLFTHKGPAW